MICRGCGEGNGDPDGICIGCLWALCSWAGRERYCAARENPALRPAIIDDWLASKQNEGVRGWESNSNGLSP